MLSRRLRAVTSCLFSTPIRTFTSLPIIDISALVSSDQDPPSVAARHAVAQQLDQACRTAGFFYVSNHGVPEFVLSGVLDEAREWFKLPEHEKAAIRIRPETGFRGWQQLGSNVTRYDGGFQRDMHEALDFYREEDPARVQQAAGGATSPIHAANQWPRQRPSFDAALRVYVEQMLGVGRSLMRGISMGLGLDEAFFDGQRAGDSYWCMRVIHYPPLAAASEPANVALPVDGEIERSVQLSCGEHTDYGLLTLVNQEQGITALQVKNAAGDWVSAPPVPGTLVCNIGDCLKFWTNGDYQSTPHRVINLDRTKSRVSVPFFYEPAFEAVVQPIQQIQGSRSAQYPPVIYGRHLESKVLSNFELYRV